MRAMGLGTGLVAAMAACALAVPALAQDGAGAIIVTGSRVDRSDYDRFYDDDQSAIGLTRKADYFVTPIYVNSDSREANLRRDEVHAMLRAAFAGAKQEGLTLVAGNYSLKPVTAADIEDLPLGRGLRPDTTRVTVYAQVPVDARSSGATVDDIERRIAAFAKSVPVTGRSYIETGSTSLAINNPDQYRGAVVKAIADESKRYAAMFGSDYGVEIRGLDSELYFNQASETEVFLYIEHSFIISPK